jgi:hypothetical protein
MSTSLDTPRDFVQSGWDRCRDIGDEWRQYTFQALNNFSYIHPEAINFEVPVDLNVDYGTFARPTAPTRPVLSEILVTLPTAPVLSDVDVPDLAPVPVEPSFALTYSKPSAPNAAMPERPDTAPVTLLDVDVGAAPALPDIEDPALYTITLPTLPDLTVPEFEGVRPVRDFTVPGRTFTWAADAYDDSLIQTIKSRLSDMTINGLGLPPAIEQAIFERGRGREDAISLQKQQEGEALLASRGLRQPAGLLTKLLRQISGESELRTSGAGRDLSIAVAQQNVEAVRFALSTAISLEMALVQANTANNELALRGAQIEQQVAIDLFNTRVALYNADWEGFKADAAVLESRIRGESLLVDRYKAQVDAQKVIGDVNESLVRALGERLRARGILIDLYRVNVEAARVKGEHNSQLLEQDRLRLQTFETDVNAWAKQQDGYRTSVEAELGNLRAQEVLGNVYGRRVEAWKTINSGYFEQARFNIETQVQQLERYRAALQGALIDSQAQVAASETKLRQYATDGSIFGIQAQVSGLEGDHADRQANLRIKSAELRIGTAQRSAELTAQHALKVIDQQIEVLKSKAAVVAQLAASSQSGVNFGASYSGGMTISGSYGTSWNYSGDTDDSNPPVYLVPGF